MLLCPRRALLAGKPLEKGSRLMRVALLCGFLSLLIGGEIASFGRNDFYVDEDERGSSFLTLYEAVKPTKNHNAPFEVYIVLGWGIAPCCFEYFSAGVPGRYNRCGD